jgi:hypothetical protein
MAFESMLPVFLHNPPQDLQDDPNVQLPFKFVGGFGMGKSIFLQLLRWQLLTFSDAQQIGMFYTLTGIVGMVMQFYVFPACATRFGVINCVKATSVVFPILYLVTPYIALVPESMRNVTVFFVVLTKLTASIFNFPSITILLTNSASSLSILGTLNGVATSVSAVGRAAGPALLGPVFSLGVKMGYVILPWWLLACVACLAAIPVPFMVEGEGFLVQAAALETDPEPVTVESQTVKHADSRARE